jgi:glutaredoxin
LLGILLTIGYSSITFAKIYKCTTVAGKTYYSERTCAVNNKSSIIEPRSYPDYVAATVAESSPDVDIYITSWCPYCKQAMAYLDAQGIAYNKYDIEDDAEAAAKKKELAPNNPGVPLTVINGQIISGYSENKFEQALKQ